MSQNEGKKMDRRTLYTRMVIREALYDLLKEKHLAQITVKEICEKADINRATFYRNYRDIYDLYEQLEEELTSSVFADGDIENDRYKLLKIIYENQSFYREFFESRLESQYIKKVIDIMYDRMKQLLIKRGTYDEQTFRISYQYNYHGVIGVIKEWLSAGCPEKPEEFGNIIYGIVEKQYQ
ncbi:MAG: TetR/AcrR family transcriptional regulator [Anaerovoracaceae bacterium]|jgi:AcrR family transcriptional regulator